MTLALKEKVRAFSLSDDPSSAARDLFAPDAAIHVVHPINTLTGPDAYADSFLAPLRSAFRDLHRRDDILMSGTFEGQHWVTTHGNYVGRFAQDWLGLTAPDRLDYLRYGEFFRFDGGRVVEAYIYLDLPQLMIATGQWPDGLPSPAITAGYTGLIPGPMTQDGLLLTDTDPGEGEHSYRIVTDMLAELATPDEAWRPYWHDRMMWYGPAAFGSFVGVDDFAAFQTPFENAFSLWSGGSKNNGVTRHFTRFGDGTYTASGGWPSLMAVRARAFLGQPSHGETLLMRVCDWWRREADLLRENWVMVDIPDVLLQMGIDLFPGRHTVAPGPRHPSPTGVPA